MSNQINGTLLSSGTIENSGKILAAGTAGMGVQFDGYGAVANAAGGLIFDDDTGVFFRKYGGLGGIVINDGTIEGARNGALLSAAGTIVNSGLLSGATYGAGIANGGGVVTNSGTIRATANAGVALQGGGTVTDGVGASITGVERGVVISGGAGVVDNSGTILGSGTSSADVNFGGGGNVRNADGGLIGGANGIVVANGYGSAINAGSLTNSGTVIGLGTLSGGERYVGQYISEGAAVRFDGYGVVANAAGGMLSGYEAGIFFNEYSSGAAGTVTNSGTIRGTGTFADGVDFFGGGFVGNGAGAMISGSLSGVAVIGLSTGSGSSSGTLGNSGTIVGGNAGVFFLGYGVITNAGGGLISGDAAGVFFYKASGGIGVVTNSGTIQGRGVSGYGAGIYFAGSGAVTNDRFGISRGSPPASISRNISAAPASSPMLGRSAATITARPLPAPVRSSTAACLPAAITALGSPMAAVSSSTPGRSSPAPPPASRCWAAAR